MPGPFVGWRVVCHEFGERMKKFHSSTLIFT